MATHFYTLPSRNIKHHPCLKHKSVTKRCVQLSIGCVLIESDTNSNMDNMKKGQQLLFYFKYFYWRVTLTWWQIENIKCIYNKMICNKRIMEWEHDCISNEEIMQVDLCE